MPRSARFNLQAVMTIGAARRDVSAWGAVAGVATMGVVESSAVAGVAEAVPAGKAVPATLALLLALRPGGQRSRRQPPTSESPPLLAGRPSRNRTRVRVQAPVAQVLAAATRPPVAEVAAVLEAEGRLEAEDKTRPTPRAPSPPTRRCGPVQHSAVPQQHRTPPGALRVPARPVPQVRVLPMGAAKPRSASPTTIN